MTKDRVVYLDLVKFVAILLVCIGHCYAMAPSILSVVRPVIYSFHMPLFMLVCGYFSFNSLELSFSKLISKKFCQLLIPVLSCTILSMSLFRGEVNELIGSVWFLRTLFLCYLTARICKYISLPVEIVFFISWLLLLVLPHGGTLMLNFLYFYFCIGYLFHKHERKINIYETPLFLISLFCFLIAICNQWTSPCEKVDLYFIIHSPIKLLMQTFIGFFGTITIIGCCKLLDKVSIHSNFLKASLSRLSVIGQYTLGIYVVQTFLIERILSAFIKLNNIQTSPMMVDFIFVPFTGFILCVLCYYIVRISRRNKIVNILFYGGLKY